MATKQHPRLTPDTCSWSNSPEPRCSSALHPPSAVWTGSNPSLWTAAGKNAVLLDTANSHFYFNTNEITTFLWQKKPIENSRMFWPFVLPVPFPEWERKWGKVPTWGLENCDLALGVAANSQKLKRNKEQSEETEQKERGIRRNGGTGGGGREGFGCLYTVCYCPHPPAHHHHHHHHIHTHTRVWH